MKRLTLTITGVIFLFASASAESKLFLSVGANLIRPADEAYRSIYGGQVLYPELAVAFRMARGFCLTGSVGEFAKDGTTPVLGLETQAKQSYLTLGIGYLHRISGGICVEAGAGGAILKFREDALDTWVEGHKVGLMAEGGVFYVPEDGQIFLGLKLGFLSASVNDIASDVAGSQQVQLGGFRISVSAGIQLFGDR